MDVLQMFNILHMIYKTFLQIQTVDSVLIQKLFI